MILTFLEWIEYWTVRWGLTGPGWLARTTQWAGAWYVKAVNLYTTIWGRLQDLTSFQTYNWIQAAIKLVQALNDVWGNRYAWFQDLYVNLVTRWHQTFVEWWDRMVVLLDTKWAWVQAWFTEWVEYATWFFDTHKLKLQYVFETDWPKLWWLIGERFEVLHNIFEFNLDGWRTFIEDPAQAIWDWVKPRLQELGAEFLAEIW